jgi:hypothetical protein
MFTIIMLIMDNRIPLERIIPINPDIEKNSLVFILFNFIMFYLNIKKKALLKEWLLTIKCHSLSVNKDNYYGNDYI